MGLGLLPRRVQRLRDAAGLRGRRGQEGEAEAVTKNTAARMPVERDRKLAAPEEPKRLPAEPLPKAAPMSAPFPCCRSTRTTMAAAAST